MLSRLTRAHQEHSNVATILPPRRDRVSVEDSRTVAPRVGISKNWHVGGIATTLVASELTLPRVRAQPSVDALGEEFRSRHVRPRDSHDERRYAWRDIAFLGIPSGFAVTTMMLRMRRPQCSIAHCTSQILSLFPSRPRKTSRYASVSGIIAAFPNDLPVWTCQRGDGGRPAVWATRCPHPKSGWSLPVPKLGGRII